MPEIALSVNSQLHAGWKDLRVTRSMEELAHSFTLGYAQVWSLRDEPFPIAAGDLCRIVYGRKTIVTGYVDEPADSYDETGHSSEVSGRSRAADLVDCSAIYKGGQWRNAGLLDIARDLCAPFNLEVSSNVDLGKPFRRYSVQDSESVFECLERAARMRGVLVLSDADGHVRFDRAGTRRTRTVLRRGVNIKSGQVRRSMSDRYSEYRVKSQTSGDDSWHGKQAAQQMHTAKDGEVGRYRPLIVLAEGQGSSDELRNRARWERNVRAGRSQRVNYTVYDWENDEGLWEPNTIVHVTDDWFRLDVDLLVVSATASRSESGGTVTELELTFPQAFDVLSLPERKERSLW